MYIINELAVGKMWAIYIFGKYSVYGCFMAVDSHGPATKKKHPYKNSNCNKTIHTQYPEIEQGHKQTKHQICKLSHDVCVVLFPWHLTRSQLKINGTIYLNNKFVIVGSRVASEKGFSDRVEIILKCLTRTGSSRARSVADGRAILGHALRLPKQFGGKRMEEILGAHYRRPMSRSHRVFTGPHSSLNFNICLISLSCKSDIYFVPLYKGTV